MRRRFSGYALAALMIGAWLTLSGASATPPATGPDSSRTVLVTTVDGPITPVVSHHLSDSIAATQRGGHAALLVQLDTPGGLDTSMREIVQSFLSAEVPIIVYVAPAGARAASAGAIITFAAHVAAMSPATTIGAATPVNAESGETASDKIINDAAAYAESVAAQRGRDTGFAADSVRQGRAATAEEALALGVVDLVAADRSALLAAVDGRTVSVAGVGDVTLHTADANLVDHELGLFGRMLAILADPTLAFLFLSIGTLAVIYELATPGTGLGGVIGAVLLILGFFALSVLPVTLAGLALLALAAALLIAEVFTPGVGVFAGGGAIALAAAGLFLFEGPVRVNPAILWPTAALLGGGTLLAGRLAWRARRRRPLAGAEAFTGRQLAVAGASGTTGRVWLDGAWWTAHSAGQPLHNGQRVQIVGVDGLTLRVEPATQEEET